MPAAVIARSVRASETKMEIPNKVNSIRIEYSRFIVLTVFFLATLLVSPARAGNISFPPEAIQAMDKIYAGDPDAAITFAHLFERSQPDHPFGYLLEDQARLWKMNCAACEIKSGLLEAWKRNKEPGDDVYLMLADKGD